jgi:serine phosphatase RsbU (regulator of sigma subunit)
MEGSGLPLGIERNELYTAHPFRLLPGDTLVLVTDGITEARRGRGKSVAFLGYEGMSALARQALGHAAPPSLRAAAQAILDGARSFGGGSLSDDACVVLVRRP